VKAFGRIDGLVSSAYKHATYGAFETDDLDAWLSSIDVTCFGALRMAKAVLPVMKAQKGGAIVNVTALAAVQPAPGQADYATAKAALEGATRQLAKEFGQYNIRVNCTRMGWLWGAPVQNFIAYQSKSMGIGRRLHQARSSPASPWASSRPTRNAPSRPCSSSPTIPA
jgi:NAD(P)-dependent dehydrogenase (short-subunit alcohol dehydrogenase family)